MNALSLAVPLYPRQRWDVIPLHGIDRSTPLAKLNDKLFEANVRTLYGDIPAALTEPEGKENFCRTLCSQHMVFSGLIW